MSSGPAGTHSHLQTDPGHLAQVGFLTLQPTRWHAYGMARPQPTSSRSGLLVMPGHQAEQHNAQALHAVQPGATGGLDHMGQAEGVAACPSCGPTFQSPLGTWEGIMCLL